MIVSNKKLSFFYGISLLFLGLVVNVSSLRAMEEHSNDLSDQDFISSLKQLTITQKNAQKLFASRYIDLVDEIDNFKNLSDSEKKAFMEQFLNIGRAFRSGEDTVFLDEGSILARPCVAIALGQRSLKDLIERYKDNDEKKKKLQKILDDSQSSPNHSYTKAFDIINFCYNEYENLSINEEKCYIELLDNIIERNQLDDSLVKQLFIECLNRCDDDFNKKEERWKNSLPIMKLKTELSKICINKLDAMENGTVDNDTGNSNEQCCMISAGLAVPAVAYLSCCAMIFGYYMGFI